MNRALWTSVLGGVAVVATVAACDSVSGPRNEPVSMTFSVPTPARVQNAGGLTLQSSGRGVVVARGSQRLRLDVVELTFSRIDLQRANAVDDRDTDVGADDGEDVDGDVDSDQRDNVRFQGPVTVTLPLQGGLIAPFRTTIPPGVYNEVKFHVESVRLVGAFDENRNGTFEENEVFGVREPVIVRLNEKFELDLAEPLVIDETTNAANITIDLAPPLWFHNRDGSLFSPRRLTNDQQLRARLRQLVRATLRAFEDSNRNGQDDRDTDR